MHFGETLRLVIDDIKVNGIIKILISSDFFIVAGFGFLGPIFAIFMSDKIQGGSLEAVGFAAAIFGLTKALFTIPVARALDMRKGEKDDFWAMLVGSLASGIVPFLYIFSTSIWQIYALQVVYGIGAAFSYTAWEAIFTRHVDKEDVAVEWSLYETMTSLSGAVAAAIGGMIAQSFGFQWLFLFSGIVITLGSGLLMLIAKKFKN